MDKTCHCCGRAYKDGEFSDTALTEAVQIYKKNLSTVQACEACLVKILLANVLDH